MIDREGYKDRLLLLAGDRNALSFAGPGVVLGSLSSDWESHDVPLSAVALDLFQPLDVQVHVSPQISLGRVLVNLLTERGQVFLGQVPGAAGSVNAGVDKNGLGSRVSDSVDVLQGILDRLGVRDFHSSDTSVHDLQPAAGGERGLLGSSAELRSMGECGGE